MKPSPVSNFILIALVSATAAAAFFVTPYRASNLDVIPDSVEYAIGANHIVTDGAYYIKIDGQRFPSRYPPWFSMLFLSPAYLIFGNEIGNAIFPVLFFSIAGVLMAFFIGRRISGDWGGILSAMALIALPLYREHARLIMTDTPCAALALLACAIFMKLRAEPPAKLGLFGLAGAVGALSGAIRPVSMSILLPFFLLCFAPQQKDKRLLKLTLVAVPPALIVSANLIYNHLTFGSPFRNGYNYWCSVPFDYSGLCFSCGYIGRNLVTILLTPIPALILTGIVFLLLDHRFGTKSQDLASQDLKVKHLTEFTASASLPVIAVHLLYFYQDDRFYLPIISLLAVICGSLAGRWFARLPQVTAPAAQGLLAAGIIIAVIIRPAPMPLARMLADNIASNTPENALILSSIDPAYLDFFVVKSTNRRIIPLSRNVEYASKVVCPQKVENPKPPPISCYDHRCEGLLKGGAREVITVTADKGLAIIKAEADKGTPVFLETFMLVASDRMLLETLQADFTLIQRGNYLYELRSKKVRADADGK